MYGINAPLRQPDGEAEVDLLLGEYRKLDPGPLEEILFFDHPAGRTRIYAAMRWKAENLSEDASLPCTETPTHWIQHARGVPPFMKTRCSKWGWVPRPAPDVHVRLPNDAIVWLRFWVEPRP